MISNPYLRVNESGTNNDFWDTVRRTGHTYPEQKLFLAVLKDALLNYRKNLRRSNKAFLAERAWFFEDEQDRLFSFVSVCAALGLSSERICHSIMAWETARSPSQLYRIDCCNQRILKIPNGNQNRVGSNKAKTGWSVVATTGQDAGEKSSARR